MTCVNTLAYAKKSTGKPTLKESVASSLVEIADIILDILSGFQIPAVMEFFV